MAITTYAELQSTVANWLHRSDLTALIPDFITLAESELNSRLKMRKTEVETPLAVTIGSNKAPLPADFVSSITLWIDDGSGREELSKALPQTIWRSIPVQRPIEWAIDGDNVLFDSALDIAYTTTLRYVQKFTLSDATPTNWLLTNHPNVYLWATLLQAQPYIVGDERIGVWSQMLEKVITQVQNKEARDRKAPLRVDAGITTKPFPYSDDGWYW